MPVASQQLVGVRLTVAVAGWGSRRLAAGHWGAGVAAGHRAVGGRGPLLYWPNAQPWPSLLWGTVCHTLLAEVFVLASTDAVLDRGQD